MSRKPLSCSCKLCKTLLKLALSSSSKLCSALRRQSVRQDEMAAGRCPAELQAPEESCSVGKAERGSLQCARASAVGLRRNHVAVKCVKPVPPRPQHARLSLKMCTVLVSTRYICNLYFA